MAKRLRYTDETTRRKCTKCSGSGSYMTNRQCWRCKGTRVETVTRPAHSQNVMPTFEMIQANNKREIAARQAASRLRREQTFRRIAARKTTEATR